MRLLDHMVVSFYFLRNLHWIKEAPFGILTNDVKELNFCIPLVTPVIFIQYTYPDNCEIILHGAFHSHFADGQ